MIQVSINYINFDIGINFNLDANFANANNPWFIRGGNYNNDINSGVFNFNRTNGNANTNNSFRPALVQIK